MKRKSVKRKSVKIIGIALIVIFLFPNFLLAASLDKYDDCNWLVSYRGRNYDLAPLVRESLARPIESDLRYALQRVPAAEDHLNSMSHNIKAARAHTMLASAFVSAFLVARILRAGEKNTDSRKQYDIASAIAGGFFFKASFESYSATREAKAELVRAVEAFNEESPHKIEPISATGKILTP